VFHVLQNLPLLGIARDRWLQIADFLQGHLRRAAREAGEVHHALAAADAPQVHAGVGAKAGGYFVGIVSEQHPGGQNTRLAAGEAVDDVDFGRQSGRVEFAAKGLIRFREEPVLVEAGIGVHIRDEGIAEMAVVENDALENLRVGLQPFKVLLQALPPLRIDPFQVARMRWKQNRRFPEAFACHPGGIRHRFQPSVPQVGQVQAQPEDLLGVGDRGSDRKHRRLKRQARPEFGGRQQAPWMRPHTALERARQFLRTLGVHIFAETAVQIVPHLFVLEQNPRQPQGGLHVGHGIMRLACEKAVGRSDILQFQRGLAVELGPIQDVPAVEPIHDGDGQQVHSTATVGELMRIGRKQVAVKGKPQKLVVEANRVVADARGPGPVHLGVDRTHGLVFAAAG
jgi:hypothetical protein